MGVSGKEVVSQPAGPQVQTPGSAVLRPPPGPPENGLGTTRGPEAGGGTAVGRARCPQDKFQGRVRVG